MKECISSPRSREGDVMLHVTEVLALAGVTDYSFVTDEAKWRGSEVHRICELYNRGRLKAKSIPDEYAGYYAALLKFTNECRFAPMEVERKLENVVLGLRGRMDARGIVCGEDVILDFKSCPIRPATALQLTLYGYMLENMCDWPRIGVELKPNGNYSLTRWPRRTWLADLATALACVRVAQWKTANGLGLRTSRE